MKKLPKIEVAEGTIERIQFCGLHKMDRTILIKVGELSLSRKALILGGALIVCQVLDGILTYAGLTILGSEGEGNALLRDLIIQFGTAPVLIGAKLFAIALAVWLMLTSHKRRWIRPVIGVIVIIYLAMAVFPWVYILSGLHADGMAGGYDPVPAKKVIEAPAEESTRIQMQMD